MIGKQAVNDGGMSGMIGAGWRARLCFAASGGMLAAAFAPLGWTALVWVALVPGLLAAASLTPREALRGGFWAGAVFWLVSLFWLTRVTWAGWFGLSLYCALYMMPFFGVVSWWRGRFGARSPWWNAGGMAVCVVMWTGGEYIRSVLATGFAWNTLGTSLHEHLPLIQIARLGGVYLVSGLIVWVNAGAGFWLLRVAGSEERGGWMRRVPVELLAGMLAWGAALAWGNGELMRFEGEVETFRVALVQPNIPQEQKWVTGPVEPAEWEVHCSNIYQRLRLLTAPVGKAGAVDLVVWPETAIPDDLLSSYASYALVYELVTNGPPILVGSMDTEWLEGRAQRYYNSSFLVETNGIVVKGYDKQHLVIFGEYVPLQDVLPFIRAMTPIQASFSAGTNSTLFRVATSPALFSALICFEDTVGELARRAVKAGARLLINQTNDAWFDPLYGSEQHVAHSVLRAVECGVPVVRSANTGVSCAIDRRGVLLDAVGDGRRRTRVAGVVIVDVPVPGRDMAMTLYVRWGDAPWAGVAAGAVGLFVWTLFRKEKKA